MKKSALVKSQLISNVASRCAHVDEEQAKAAVQLILELMTTSLSEKNRIEIRGFGVLHVKFRPARQSRNPKTGERVAASAAYLPSFKCSAALHRRLNTDHNAPTTQVGNDG